MKKKTLTRIAALVLAVVLVISGCAVVFSSNTTTSAVAETIADDTLLVTVNGVEIRWSDVSGYYDSLVANYGSYYDLTDETYANLFKATAMDEGMTLVVLDQMAVEMGIEITEDQKTAAVAEADESWDEAIQSYIEYYGLSTETDEDKVNAIAQAEAYYLEAGYTKAILEESYVSNLTYDAVYDEVTKSGAVSDEDLQAYIDTLVAEDQALYEDDLEGYCTAVSNAELMAYYYYMYYGTYEVEYPYYKPAGFRAVKHILLSVDEELMTAYTDLLSKYEEQQAAAETATEATEEAAEEATEEAAEETVEEEIVTLEMVNEAKAAVLASRQDDIDAIMTRYAAGEDFDALITEFDGDFDTAGGTGTFEMCAYSTGYVDGFVDAGMSIAAIGELSAPVVTSYGIHILQYVEDVPGGAVALTDTEREAIRSELEEDAKSELYSAAVEAYIAKSDVVYTGVIPTIDEVYAQLNAAD